MKTSLKQGIILILTGLGGLIASFRLTLDKLLILENPNVDLICDINGIIQCGANLDSWQGSVFGFPNSLLGLIAFSVFITIGVVRAVGVELPRWVNVGLLAGTLFSYLWVVWFIYQSFFVIGTLCIWCSLMWVSVIIMFWGNLGITLQEKQITKNPHVVKAGSVIMSWGWVIIVLNFLTVGSILLFLLTT